MMPRSIDWYKRELKPASSISWQVARFYAIYILGLPCPIILTSRSSVKFRLFWRLWPPSSSPSFGGCVTTIPSSMARVRTSFIKSHFFPVKSITTIGIHSNLQVHVAASLKTSKTSKNRPCGKICLVGKEYHQLTSRTLHISNSKFVQIKSNQFKLLIRLFWPFAVGHINYPLSRGVVRDVCTSILFIIVYVAI